MEKTNTTLFIKRILLLIIGTCFISFGIAFFSYSKLGMSPISSYPYVMSLLIPQITLGKWVLLWNMFFAILQIPVEGKNYKWYLLFQIPLAFLLGYMADFATYILSPIESSFYPARLGFAIIGTVLTAIGVFLTVRANLILNGPEAFVHSLSNRTGKKFGTLKVGYDIFCVVLAVTVSLITLKRVEGVREGTLISMIFTGIIVNWINRIVAIFENKQKKN